MKRLHKKYIVQKANGKPIDPKADYFVLRLDTDTYARTAAMAYAECIRSENVELSNDLRGKVSIHRAKAREGFENKLKAEAGREG